VGGGECREKLSILLIDIPRIRIDTNKNIVHRTLQRIPQWNLWKSGIPRKDIEPMGKKLYPADTLKQAQSILSAWKQIDPALKIGPLTVETIAADVATVKALQEKIIQLKSQLLNMRSQRDAAILELWNTVKRSRSGIKGIYGDDSTAYELAGGTRRSQRKKPRRRPRPVSPEYEDENSR
jgi:DNA-binding protein H-NS